MPVFTGGAPQLAGRRQELVAKGDQLPEQMPVFADGTDQLGRERIK